ncbi:MAG: transposase [Nitrospinaceae bacterium]
MNRGSNRSPIFRDRRDYEEFLQTLWEACGLFKVSVYAYCLMPNHYHVLIVTPEGNASRFMRHLNGVYTQRFNRAHNRDGPLFRGRYKSVLVQADDYLLQVVRYIHLNPVKGKLVDRPREYEWSSYNFYLRPQGEPGGLGTEWVLSLFSRQRKKAVQAFRKFMGDPVSANVERFYSSRKLGSILGDDGFVERIKEQYIYSDPSPDMEVREIRRFRGEGVIQMINREICRTFKVKEESLFQGRRGRKNLPRQMAVSLSRELSGLNLREIAESYGIKSYKTVESHYSRIQTVMKEDRKLTEKYLTIKNRCRQEEI